MLPFQTDKKPQNIVLHNSNSRCSKHMVTDIPAMLERFCTRLVLAFSPTGHIALVHWAATEAPFGTLKSCYCDFLSCLTELLGPFRSDANLQANTENMVGNPWHWKLTTRPCTIVTHWKQIFLSMIKWVMWYYCYFMQCFHVLKLQSKSDCLSLTFLSVSEITLHPFIW